MKTEPQILLTNDDGIKSPGLWAAAEALSDLGFGNLPSYYTSSYSVGLSYNLSYSTLLGPSQAKAQRRIS